MHLGRGDYPIWFAVTCTVHFVEPSHDVQTCLIYDVVQALVAGENWQLV